ncbi:MAG: hypothetical protein DWQ10_17575 [Calditrichaeota bacterium]|nr:MAG: hypothetical protein DWQ10_17575 [Calditrichota bacterium]
MLMKIFDCFTFFNELDLLELRLSLLYPHVDFFVLVEANSTFTGQPKSYHFEVSKDRFTKYMDKIIHVKVDDLPKPKSKTNCWNVEWFQRDAIQRGLEGTAEPGDAIFVSDVDEFVKPESIALACKSSNWISFQMDLFFYYFNYKSSHTGLGPVKAHYGDFKSIQQIRYSVEDNELFKNAGWHFSFMGGEDQIIKKLNAYAESQTNVPELNNRDIIRYKIKNGMDIFNRDGVIYQLIEIDKFSAEIRAFLDKYPHYRFNPKDYEHLEIDESLLTKTNYAKRSIWFRLRKKLYKLWLKHSK